jgi:hypothetical protein
MRLRRRSKKETETSLGFSGPTIRGPRISLWPPRISGFGLNSPRVRVKGRQDPVARAGATLINRIVSKLFRSIFKR